MYRYWVYIVGNKSATAVYIGVTNNLQRRIAKHKEGAIPGFTQRYRCNRLLYFEEYKNIKQAIAREKELKGWRRERKESLVATLNPHRVDLACDWF
ncbi:MAG: GIY-YIG nuclease family protein [Alistipes sp.]|nr:GIY-YIG nuclease family protein [Alistipes sp.]